MVRKVAEYTVQHWKRPDNGIWELDAAEHYVSGKVMSWVALERASRIAERLETDASLVRGWRAEMDEIRTEVLRDGWSNADQTFRQRYSSEALDASVLLVAVMGFLPPEDARLRSTLERLEADLMVNGLLHRFRPNDLPGEARSDLPVGEFEGAFLPCCFWLATAHARDGRPEAAEAILNRVDEAAGELGLLAEEMDARSGVFLGNTPLLFSHAEYLRAVIETAKARPLGKVELMAGMAVREVRRLGQH